jgi:hypothetical protein
VDLKKFFSKAIGHGFEISKSQKKTKKLFDQNCVPDFVKPEDISASYNTNPIPKNDFTLTPKIVSHSNDEKIYTALE